MKSAINTLASVVVAFTASVASAQPFLEFHVQGQTNTTIGVTPFELKAVFDASAPTTQVFNEFYSLDAVYFEFLDPSSTSDSPVSTGDPMVDTSPMVWLTINSELKTLGLNVGFNDPSDSSVSFSRMLGDFSDLANSIPDDPEAYRIDISNPSAQMSLFTPQGNVSWCPTFGFKEGAIGPGTLAGTGGFTVRIRIVEDPNAPEPCIADLNNDGNLNFLDISRYLDLYGDGCP